MIAQMELNSSHIKFSLKQANPSIMNPASADSSCLKPSLAPAPVDLLLDCMTYLGLGRGAICVSISSGRLKRSNLYCLSFSQIFFIFVYFVYFLYFLVGYGLFFDFLNEVSRF